MNLIVGCCYLNLIASSSDVQGREIREPRTAGMATKRSRSRSFIGLGILLLLPVCLAKYDRPIMSDKDFNKRKEACYADIDNGLWGRVCRTPWIAKENCALRCVSPACYSTIYGQDHLEEGELDFKRGREFRTCLRRELLEARKAEKY